ncbi:MAG: ATP-binding cassette domain-containing protein [Opitutales bacterium]|nr:ATP-binding cassette domain-containing protein [Opitutales bacterium]
MSDVAFSVLGLSKVYPIGDLQVIALDDVSLVVPKGDYLAIMGPSGSGKSTLLNILGCLDRPTSGDYEIDGKGVNHFSDEKLSELRGQSIGFVFQSYNLISYLTVDENIALPRNYVSNESGRQPNPAHLASLVGLADRRDHRPQQLSGGQQQRVGIARSLANDPAFILADEPTGNLDTTTTEEILGLLDKLNGEGKTIVLVTHEEEVAKRARRIVRMKDGAIIEDHRSREPAPSDALNKQEVVSLNNEKGSGSLLKGIWTNLGKGAFQSIFTHPMRSILTGLGVFIGVVSVLWLLAIGEGIAAEAEEEIMQLGANNIIISSKRPPESERSSKGQYFYSYGLTHNDYFKLTQSVPHIQASYVTRELDRRTVFTKDGKKRAELLGCLSNYRNLHNLVLTRGRFLTEEDNREKAEVCVIASKLAKILFPFGDALGNAINIGGNLYRVVGEVAPRRNLKDRGNLGFKEIFEDNVYIPIETMWSKIFDFSYRGYDGSPLLSKIILTIDNQGKLLTISEMIQNILGEDHGMEDFQITVPLELMEQAERAKLTFISLMGLVAGISLFVGGVGIMNIMLATVTERTREVGIRRAIGAKKKDIILQFLIETITLTGLGGLAGIVAGFLCKPAYSMILNFMENWTPSIYESLPASMQNMTPVLVLWSLPLVFFVAVVTGVIFGLYPAKKASEMNPVDALRHVV